jgi:hypothetical protein
MKRLPTKLRRNSIGSPQPCDRFDPSRTGALCTFPLNGVCNIAVTRGFTFTFAELW